MVRAADFGRLSGRNARAEAETSACERPFVNVGRLRFRDVSQRLRRRFGEISYFFFKSSGRTFSAGTVCAPTRSGSEGTTSMSSVGGAGR